ncbi:MAG: NACHT domain-containing protein [Thainema sp.]
MVSPLWFWLLAQAASGNAPPSKQEQMLEWLSGNPTIGWGIAIFAVLAMAVAAVAKLTGNLDNIIGFLDKYRPKKREITEEERQKLRRQLIDVVLRQVVKRLEDSLHHKIRMDLRYQEERQRVGRKDLPPVEKSRPLDQFIRRAVNSFGKPVSSTPVETEASTAALLKRDDIKGRLLILGEPGAGKTNELLAVAKELLQQAQQADDAPIPVIFELSEWSSEPGETFADWLIEQLQQKYTVPPQVAQQWIDQNQLFPLLDGLDELRRVDSAENASSEEIDRKRQARQIQCMRAINAFLDMQPSTSMVVCCRRKEYEALEAQSEYLKRLNGAIYLQELDDEQIEDYLDTPDLKSLWNALLRQPILLRLMRSPLFLLMLVVVYQGQLIPRDKVLQIKSINELLDLYIDTQLEDFKNREAYPPGKSPTVEETHHYLSWLAKKLEEQGVTEFLIERLQPSWLDRECDKTQYRMSFGWINRQSIGLRDIESVENLRFSSKKILWFGLISGLFYGLLMGLIHILINHVLISGLKSSLIQSLFFGLVGGLVGGLIFGLTTSESEIEDKQLPNQGIRRSMRTARRYGLLLGSTGGLIFVLVGWLSRFSRGIIIQLIFGLIDGLLYGLIFGLIGALFFGLIPTIQHLSLRHILYDSGVAPWNYEKFLQHAENHRFIQRVGGRYRFVHDLLRKRFAERYQPKWR